MTRAFIHSAFLAYEGEVSAQDHVDVAPSKSLCQRPLSLAADLLKLVVNLSIAVISPAPHGL